MITLMMKDIRQTLWPLLLAAVLLVAPTAVWALGIATEKHGAYHEVWRELSGCAWFGAGASLLAASAIAAVAFAKERRERTFELIATLPVQRWKVVTSKGMAALLVSLGPCVVGLAIGVALMAMAERTPWGQSESVNVMSVARMICTSWLLLFGLGWGLSAVLRGEVLAAAVPMLVFLIVGMAILNWGRPEYGTMPAEEIDRVVFARLTWTFGTLGAAGLIAGTVVALRRRSP